jgi:hypothetical protein
LPKSSGQGGQGGQGENGYCYTNAVDRVAGLQGVHGRVSPWACAHAYMLGVKTALTSLTTLTTLMKSMS